MNDNLLQKRKWFWSWQDDRQEAWLEEMSQQGLHLAELGYFGAYRFRKGSPKDYAYRMDFNVKGKSDDYFEFIEEAGWEHLGTLTGWQYWRKEKRAGESNEFYTDKESKIRKYQRLLQNLVIYTPSTAAMMVILLAMFKRFPGRHPGWFVGLCIGAFLISLLFMLLNAVMVQARIRKLRQAPPL